MWRRWCYISSLIWILIWNFIVVYTLGRDSGILEISSGKSLTIKSLNSILWYPMPWQAVNKFYRNLLPALYDKNYFSWRWNNKIPSKVVLTSHNTWNQARQVITTMRVSDLTNTQGCRSGLGLCFPVIVIEILGISIISGWKYHRVSELEFASVLRYNEER